MHSFLNVICYLWTILFLSTFQPIVHDRCMEKETPCPCYSEKTYEECCLPYHEGQPPENALLLMRSRYSAYALHLIDYIMETTHPDYPDQQLPKEEWKRQIQEFCTQTEFRDLRIVDFTDGKVEAFVTFDAKLFQGPKNCSFREKSKFLKVDDRWLFHSGKHFPCEL